MVTSLDTWCKTSSQKYLLYHSYGCVSVSTLVLHTYIYPRLDFVEQKQLPPTADASAMATARLFPRKKKKKTRAKNVNG